MPKLPKFLEVKEDDTEEEKKKKKFLLHKVKMSLSMIRKKDG